MYVIRVMSTRAQDDIKTSSQQKLSKTVVAPFCVISRPLLYGGAVLTSLLIALSITHVYVESPISAVQYRLPSSLPLTGSLSVNNRLSAAEFLLEDQIYGPESLAVNSKTGMVYTGLKTGLICELKLFGKKPKITRAVRLSSIEGCDGSYKLMSKCGRPLGMRFNAETNELVVLDAYLGLFVINWTTEKVRQLFTGGAMISNNDNAPPIRILIYNPSTEDLSVLIDNLYFPNGIQVVQGKILISEMGKTRLLKYSPSSEILSVLLDKLPGYPDNLRLASSGMVWVPLSALRSDEDNWIAERPWLREILTKILSPQAFHFIANCFINKYGMVLKINPMTGEIIESLHDTLGRISDISIAVEDGQGNLLLGSDVNYHIARVKL